MPHQVLLLDTPRSGSHLLARMIGYGTNTKHLDSPFSAARGKQVGWMLREGHEKGMTDLEDQEFTTALQAGIQQWREALAEAEKTNQILFLKDHILNSSPGSQILQIHFDYTAPPTHPTPNSPYLPAGANPTRIPDDLLLAPGTIPLLLIRHPILTIPSALRVLARMNLPHGGGRTNLRTVTSQDHSRLLYDFYRSHATSSKPIMPLIIDYDDLVTNPEAFTQHLCTLTGLDPLQTQFSWAAITEERKREIHPLYYISQTRLEESSGVMPELAGKNRDLEAERKAWRTEFSKEDVVLMEEMVDKAMANYEFLFERRVVLPPA